MGTCGFKNLNQVSRHAEIGGNYSSSVWGRGYATEALNALLRYGFTVLRLNKIYAQASSDNESVMKLLNNYGFTQEGRLQEHLRLNDACKDLYMFSLLKNEYTD
nr:GNAT family protein [Salicibibacter kimchii]